MGRLEPFSLFRAILLTTPLLLEVVAKAPAFLEQGFYFDWNPPGTTIPIPVTAQCDLIHITWERGSASGPNPTAPYYLQIYTSTFIVPFVVAAGEGTSFDFPVPFNPGTQYQICMFDKNGVTGGCQEMYTVIAAPNATAQNPPTCQNVTFPAGAMEVDASVSDGPFSQFGWIEECTDITVTAKNGTPPYTFTIAPALHPPLNITSNSLDPITWTVSLSWGFPFFISLVDSLGNKWSQGPLHSGEGKSTRCLDINASDAVEVKEAVAVGSAIGGLVIGTLLGIAAILACRYFRSRREFTPVFVKSSTAWDISRRHSGFDGPSSYSGALDSDMMPLSHAPRDASANSRETTATTGSNAHYHIEPFVMSASRSENSTPGLTIDTSSTGLSVPPLLPLPGAPSPGAGSSDQRAPTSPGASTQQHVYVVHHDGGRAPVTVYTEQGTEVVELPPRYIDSSSSSTPLAFQQPRQPGVTPRKARRPRPS